MYLVATCNFVSEIKMCDVSFDSAIGRDFFLKQNFEFTILRNQRRFVYREQRMRHTKKNNMCTHYDIDNDDNDDDDDAVFCF